MCVARSELGWRHFGVLVPGAVRARLYPVRPPHGPPLTFASVTLLCLVYTYYLYWLYSGDPVELLSSWSVEMPKKAAVKYRSLRSNLVHLPLSLFASLAQQQAVS